jgi:hypothetical protein
VNALRQSSRFNASSFSPPIYKKGAAVGLTVLNVEKHGPYKSIFAENNQDNNQDNKDITNNDEIENITKYKDDINNVNLNEKNNSIKKNKQEDKKQQSTIMTSKQPKINNNKVFIENIYSKALLSRNINISINKSILFMI